MVPNNRSHQLLHVHDARLCRLLVNRRKLRFTELAFGDGRSKPILFLVPWILQPDTLPMQAGDGWNHCNCAIYLFWIRCTILYRSRKVNIPLLAAFHLHVCWDRAHVRALRRRGRLWIAKRCVQPGPWSSCPRCACHVNNDLSNVLGFPVWYNVHIAGGFAKFLLLCHGMPGYALPKQYDIFPCSARLGCKARWPNGKGLLQPLLSGGEFIYLLLWQVRVDETTWI